jgi:hypothetical protein
MPPFHKLCAGSPENMHMPPFHKLCAGSPEAICHWSQDRAADHHRFPGSNYGRFQRFLSVVRTLRNGYKRINSVEISSPAHHWTLFCEPLYTHGARQMVHMKQSRNCGRPEGMLKRAIIHHSEG